MLVIVMFLYKILVSVVIATGSDARDSPYVLDVAAYRSDAHPISVAPMPPQKVEEAPKKASKKRRPRATYSLNNNIVNEATPLEIRRSLRV